MPRLCPEPRATPAPSLKRASDVLVLGGSLSVSNAFCATQFGSGVTPVRPAPPWSDRYPWKLECVSTCRCRRDPTTPRQVGGSTPHCSPGLSGHFPASCIDSAWVQRSFFQRAQGLIRVRQPSHSVLPTGSHQHTLLVCNRFAILPYYVCIVYYTIPFGTKEPNLARGNLPYFGPDFGAKNVFHKQFPYRKPVS